MKTKTKKKQTASIRSKVIISEVPERVHAKLSVNCKAHGKLMNKVGQSERGLPLYFCEEGCMAEVGVGRVKKFIADDGFGFIYKKGEDMFFHVTNLVGVNSVNRGDLVSFRVGYNKRKRRLQAVQVESLNRLRRDC